MNICLPLRQWLVAIKFNYYTLGLARFVNSIINDDFTSLRGYEMADAVRFSLEWGGRLCEAHGILWWH